eukprot:CAMPEP_0181331250 /NCGR_PEP_ID=MMETSP1101-20121128/24392_1 /TAXON_ID=46948 /ORGANISM="Rhodomonas abbreviata, Strain Caron Lab Isolate" /LENGTH=189 /DNA_ID=CAMNT_0023440679 /DNA_START=321 /DNA_END=890 /DNA_ORIENTATION=+
MSCCYTFHQFEEYGFDIFGARYSYINHLCHILHSEVQIELWPHVVATGCPADQEALLFINVCGVMSMMFVPFLLPARLRVLATLFNLAFVAGNAAIFHIAPFILTGGHYNAGLAQCVLMNLPIALWAARHLMRDNSISPAQLAGALLLAAFPGQPLLVLGPSLLLAHGLVSKAIAQLLLLSSLSLAPAA